MSKSQLKAMHLEDERNEAHYRQCVPPCKRYMSAGDTHSLCVVCLGARHAELGLEGALPTLRAPPTAFASLPELVDVVTRAMAKLNINWPFECHVKLQRGKLDEGFLRFKIPPPHRSLPFFPNLHTEVSRSWAKPFLARLFVP